MVHLGLSVTMVTSLREGKTEEINERQVGMEETKEGQKQYARI